MNEYAPPEGKLKCASLIKLLNFTDDQCIILGGLNGNNAMWESGRMNHNDNIILKCLIYIDLIVLNHGSATRFSFPCQNISAVDISVASPEVACNITWRILENCVTVTVTHNYYNKQYSQRRFHQFH